MGHQSVLVQYMPTADTSIKQHLDIVTSVVAEGGRGLLAKNDCMNR